ncbi:26S proteasome complex subunit [Lobaria immixta]|nr:26S proteasome complex subunit [Lobaria immixta]
MSAAAEDSGQTTKAIVSDATSSAALKEPQKPAAALEEDDEFEDFPVEDWPLEDAEGPGERDNTHLWEESWDDDDTSEDFSKQLKQELEKVKGDKQ